MIDLGSPCLVVCLPVPSVAFLSQLGRHSPHDHSSAFFFQSASVHGVEHGALKDVATVEAGVGDVDRGGAGNVAIAGAAKV